MDLQAGFLAIYLLGKFTTGQPGFPPIEPPSHASCSPLEGGVLHWKINPAWTFLVMNLKTAVSTRSSGTFGGVHWGYDENHGVASQKQTTGLAGARAISSEKTLELSGNQSITDPG
jgi:hypothetical protein